MANETYLGFIDKAKNFACGVYKEVPGALVPNPSDAGYKQIWDNLCFEPPPSSLPGLPPKPTSPFMGGQCCDGYYYVNYTNFYTGIPDDGKRTSRELFGRILGMKMIQFPDRRTFVIEYERCDGTKLYEDAVTGGASDLSSVITSVTPSRANPDNCGNPPKKFPPAPPVPPGGYKSPPTPMPDNDGDINEYIFNFYPPQKIDFPDVPFPPIVINVAGAAGAGINLDFDINFNFNGDVSFTRPGGGNDLPPALAGGFQNLGDGIAGVSGGVGGLRNDFGGFAGTLGGVASNLGGVGASLADLAGKLDFKFAPPPFINAPEIDKEVEEVTGGGKQDENKEGLLGILVTLTTPAKEVIFGNPNVYFAGWLTFFSQGGYEVREPIHFEKSYFPAPDGATGYGLTFTKGAKGTITVFSKSIPE